MRPIRVSIIGYLNTVPLTWSLLRDQPPGLRFDFTVPSQCAADLAAGRADVGIIPSIEYQRIPGLSVLAGPAIAARGRVRSILLLSRVPLAQVRTVAADTSSRTSIALADLILRVQHGAKPEMLNLAPDPQMMLRECDAAVVIGDPALRYSVHPLEGVHAWDLAEQWRQWTGLPFVFAFWAARSSVATPELARIFSDARDRGVAAIPSLIAGEAHRRELPHDLVADYLTHRIHFDLDEESRTGLDRFYELCAEHGIIGRPARLRLVEPAPVEAPAGVELEP